MNMNRVLLLIAVLLVVILMWSLTKPMCLYPNPFENFCTQMDGVENRINLVVAKFTDVIQKELN